MINDEKDEGLESLYRNRKISLHELAVQRFERTKQAWTTQAIKQLTNKGAK
jgi:hypothetical protein